MHRRHFLSLAACAAALPAAATTRSSPMTYYVAMDGDDSGPGTSRSPWRTLPLAIGRLRPGDELVARAGIWPGKVTIRRVRGDDGAPITIRSETPRGAKLTGGFLAMDCSHLRVTGFDVSGSRQSGISLTNCHNITVDGNALHHNANAGVYSYGCDWLTITGNEVFGNAGEGVNSGISVHKPKVLVDGTGYRIVVAGNIIHDNCQKPPDAGEGNNTDGNGIILDDWLRADPPFTGPALIARNRIWGNGSDGILLNRCANIRVQDNDLGYNGTDPHAAGKLGGEIGVRGSSDCTFLRNIMVSAPSGKHCAVAVVDLPGFASSRLDWRQNVTWNGTAGAPSVRTTPGTPGPAAALNRLGVDPKFTDAARGDFRLKPGSPALNLRRAA